MLLMPVSWSPGKVSVDVYSLGSGKNVGLVQFCVIRELRKDNANQ